MSLGWLLVRTQTPKHATTGSVVGLRTRTLFKVVSVLAHVGHAVSHAGSLHLTGIDTLRVLDSLYEPRAAWLKKSACCENICIFVTTSAGVTRSPRKNAEAFQAREKIKFAVRSIENDGDKSCEPWRPIFGKCAMPRHPTGLVTPGRTQLRLCSSNKCELSWPPAAASLVLLLFVAATIGPKPRSIDHKFACSESDMSASGALPFVLCIAR